MIIVYTGDGKGKTTAAIGAALRLSGYNQRTAIVQFLKGYKQTGEWRALKNNSMIDIYQFRHQQSIIPHKPNKNDEIAVKKAILKIYQLLSTNKYSLIVMDEINNAIYYDLIRAADVIKLIKSYPKVDFILTGRNASSEILKIADLTTEMVKIKHPFDSGKSAKKGIDY